MTQMMHNDLQMTTSRMRSIAWLKQLWIALRPTHWIKNAFLFPALIFSGHFRNLADVLRTLEGFMVFSLVASSVYLFNDLIDREQDSRSESSKARPISTGAVTPVTAILAALALQAGSIVWGIWLGQSFLLWIVLYTLNNIVYSLYIKNKVIADVISIAAGFVIRIMAGAALIEIVPSHWLVICTFSLALLLGFGKRRAELLGAPGVKVVSTIYTEDKLDHMISVSAAITLLSYMLYAVAPESVQRFKGTDLIYTVPFVVYGIFRFVAKIQEGKCKDPVHLFYSDWASTLNIMLWAIVVFAVVARAYYGFE